MFKQHNSWLQSKDRVLWSESLRDTQNLLKELRTVALRVQLWIQKWMISQMDNEAGKEEESECERAGFGKQDGKFRLV